MARKAVARPSGAPLLLAPLVLHVDQAYVPVEPKAPKIPEGPQRCSRCSEMKPLVSFRPSEVEKETKKRVAFDEVLSHILASDATRESHPDLFAAWDEVRTSQCVSCREYHRSYVADEETTAGQCRALWYELRKAPCVDCGRDDGFSEYDHQADRGEKKRSHRDNWMDCLTRDDWALITEFLRDDEVIPTFFSLWDAGCLRSLSDRRVDAFWLFYSPVCAARVVALPIPARAALARRQVHQPSYDTRDVECKAAIRHNL